MVKTLQPEGESYDIELQEDLLKAHQKIADKNAKLLRSRGVRCIEIMGSIGSGKTSLLEQISEELSSHYRMAVVNGDLATTIDADRVGKHGVKVLQINTGKECHLDAAIVARAFGELDLKDLDLLFIENVGNLICPAEFPLGADTRVVVVSVTEGPYMVLKHPLIFMDSKLLVVNKIDLADLMQVSAQKLGEDAKRINPKIRIAFTNCRTGEGVDDVIEQLQLSGKLRA